MEQEGILLSGAMVIEIIPWPIRNKRIQVRNLKDKIYPERAGTFLATNHPEIKEMWPPFDAFMILIVKVTEKDIKKGKKLCKINGDHCNECPIALAGKRLKSSFMAHTAPLLRYFGNNGGEFIQHGEVLEGDYIGFIEKFDRGLKVKPETFVFNFRDRKYI